MLTSSTHQLRGSQSDDTMRAPCQLTVGKVIRRGGF